MLGLTVRGKRSDLGLGSALEVSLAEAREKAAELRKAIREGKDPIAVQRAAKSNVPTFREAAQEEFELRQKGWLWRTKSRIRLSVLIGAVICLASAGS